MSYYTQEMFSTGSVQSLFKQRDNLKKQYTILLDSTMLLLCEAFVCKSLSVSPNYTWTEAPAQVQSPN